MKLIDKLSGLQKYSVVISFLALEVFAFIAFSFGNSFILFGVLSLVLLILLVLFTIKEITIDGVSRIAILFFPLFLYVLLTAVGKYSSDHYKWLGDFNVAELVFIPIGILSIALCGYLLSLNKTFKLKTFFIVIYSALALLVLLNLLVNLINFGFFYTVIYKNYYMYYGGLRSSVPIQEMAYTLEAFNFVEVRMDHYVLYPLLLLSSSAFLFFIKPKAEKKMFVFYLLFSVLGVFALVFIPSIYGLLGALVVIVTDAIIFLCHKFRITKKVVKYGFFALILMFIVVMLVMLIISQPGGVGLYNKIKSSTFLSRVFISNRLAIVYLPLIKDLFVLDRYLGYTAYWPNPDIVNIYSIQHLSGSYVFDNFMTSGLIGNAAFLVFLLIAIKGFKDYLFKEDDEEYRNKGLLFSFFSVFFVYSLFFNNGEYGIFYTIIKPIYMTGPFMIAVFIIFYTYSKGRKPKPVKEEKIDE